ncbi:MAG: cytochrome c oxidase subunit 3 [Pseudomonadota bacterium]
MAGQKQHDFHIVDPSPWPLVAAFSVFLMLTGIVLWVNGDADILTAGTPIVFGLGFVAVNVAAFLWWSDVVRESHTGEHTPVVRIGLRYGVILFIMSEIMFFAAWFWMWGKHWLYPMPTTAGAEGALGGNHGTIGVWPPQGIELVDPWHLPLLNTLLLLTSGAAATWAHHAVMENDRKGVVNGLMLAVILGVIFTAVQAYEYYEILHLGWFDDGSWIYGSSFFLATGFHGFHVIIGTIFLIVCLMRALRGHFSPDAHVGFEAGAWYWHFVDVVWLFLFALIYVGVLWFPNG